MSVTGSNVFQGRRLLLIEDEFFIAYDTAINLQTNGAYVIGPVATIDEAMETLAAAGHVDGALLDLNLQGDMSYPVADALLQRGVPFVFTTGYDQGAIPPRYSGVKRCEKPLDLVKVAEALFQ